MRVLECTNEGFVKLIGIPKDIFYYFTSLWKNNDESKKKKLSPEDQILLLFIFLRHYSVTNLIASMFEVSYKTVNRVLNLVLPFIYNILKDKISLGTFESRIKESFKFYQYPITFIIDGTEIPFHGSKNLFRNSYAFSKKKKQHSLTLLCIISPEGRILYFSKLAFGSVVDNELVINTKNEWYDLLDKKEFGFGDRGFNGL